MEKAAALHELTPPDLDAKLDRAAGVHETSINASTSVESDKGLLFSIDLGPALPRRIDVDEVNLQGSFSKPRVDRLRNFRSSARSLADG